MTKLRRRPTTYYLLSIFSLITLSIFLLGCSKEEDDSNAIYTEKSLSFGSTMDAGSSTIIMGDIDKGKAIEINTAVDVDDGGVCETDPYTNWCTDDCLGDQCKMKDGGKGKCHNKTRKLVIYIHEGCECRDPNNPQEELASELLSGNIIYE